MKDITTELNSFFEATGIRQCQLAKASGISTATINRLVKGVQSDVRLSTAESLRRTIFALRRVKTSELESDPNNISLVGDDPC